MRKKIIAILIVLISLCLLFAVIRFWAVSTKEVYFTDSIEDYNSKKYPLIPEVFLDSIPSTADVVSFSYYNYWHEAKDMYLELKFSSTDEMESYLSDLREHSLQCSKVERDWFIAEQNPYDPAFTDLFCTLFLTTVGDQTYTGYTMDPAQNVIFDCNFAVISYSYEKLTVIQSYVGGNYQHNVHNYTPRYFLRFDVPMDERHNRLIHVD